MVKCSQQQCPVATTGVCLEGHVEGCPHLLPESTSPEQVRTEESKSNTAVEAALEPFRFFSGEKLTVAEASRITNEVPTVVVMCAGAQRAGKTTFLARIGELFRTGSFEDIHFAGSMTLCAFERLSWLATIASGASRPDTKRSHRTEMDRFLHIRVRPNRRSTRLVDLLICDLPGEHFPTALASRDFCAEQRALARADHLVVFVDCACLIHPHKRHSELDNTLSFLRQVAGCKQDVGRLKVYIVFSRWDYVCLHDNAADHEAYCNIVQSEVMHCCGRVFGGVSFIRIAARPVNMSPSDTEIRLLFAEWLKPSQLPNMQRDSRNTTPERDFLAYGLK